MKVAILGWGSLIWDKHSDFDNNHEEWAPGGPKLKLEFSRISKTRNGALALVIDEKNGGECEVQYAFSKRKTPDDAICDLRSREGTVLRRIGYHFADGSQICKPDVPKNITAWAKEKEIDVVIWTGLPSNFCNENRGDFSIENAISYIQKLSPEGKAKAAEYLWRAPDFIDTPLRRALQVEPWFHKS